MIEENLKNKSFWEVRKFNRPLIIQALDKYPFIINNEHIELELKSEYAHSYIYFNLRCTELENFHSKLCSYITNFKKNKRPLSHNSKLEIVGLKNDIWAFKKELKKIFIQSSEQVISNDSIRMTFDNLECYLYNISSSLGKATNTLIDCLYDVKESIESLDLLLQKLKPIQKRSLN